MTAYGQQNDYQWLAVAFRSAKSPTFSVYMVNPFIPKKNPSFWLEPTQSIISPSTSGSRTRANTHRTPQGTVPSGEVVAMHGTESNFRAPGRLHLRTKHCRGAGPGSTKPEALQRLEDAVTGGLLMGFWSIFCWGGGFYDGLLVDFQLLMLAHDWWLSGGWVLVAFSTKSMWVDSGWLLVGCW